VALHDVVQLIGIATVPPVLVLSGFIILGSVGVYENGWLPAEQLNLLRQEIGRRLDDKTEELSSKALKRLERILKLYAKSMANAQEENLGGFDAAMAAFTDNTVDANLIAQRRDELHQVVIESLKERCRGTALATDIINRWQYWTFLEKTWLRLVAVQDIGVRVFRYFMRTVGERMAEAGVLGLLIGLLAWGISLPGSGRKPDLLSYAGNSGTLGAFIGLGIAMLS
jgi:hypothetical protein